MYAYRMHVVLLRALPAHAFIPSIWHVGKCRLRGEKVPRPRPDSIAAQVRTSPSCPPPLSSSAQERLCQGHPIIAWLPRATRMPLRTLTPERCIDLSWRDAAYRRTVRGLLWRETPRESVWAEANACRQDGVGTTRSKRCATRTRKGTGHCKILLRTKISGTHSNTLSFVHTHAAKVARSHREGDSCSAQRLGMVLFVQSQRCIDLGALAHCTHCRCTFGTQGYRHERA